MSLREMFVALRQFDVADDKWKVSVREPANRSYKVLEHTRENIPDTIDSGKVTFKLSVDGDNANTLTLVGTVNAADKNETVTKDGQKQSEGNIDGGIGKIVTIRGFPPRIKITPTVIVKFEFNDPADDDGTIEYRFEGPLPASISS